MKGPAKVNERRPKTRLVLVTTYFPADADWREDRSLTELLLKPDCFLVVAIAALRILIHALPISTAGLHMSEHPWW